MNAKRKLKVRRSVYILMSLCLTAVLLGGCGKKQIQKTDNEEEAVEIPMILTVSPTSGKKSEQELVDAFNITYKGKYHIAVEWIMETEDDYRQNLKRLNVTDKLPAVITDLRMLPSYYRLLVEDHRIVDLAPYIEADQEWKQMIEPVVLDSCSEEDGSVYLGPVSTAAFSCSGIFWNEELFEQAGITEEPKTWDEFKDVCQKLKDAGITPMTMDDAYATCVIGYHLARLVGEDKVKEIVTEGEWDDPAVLQMAQDIEELASNGYYSEMVGSNVWPAGQNTELALGTAAMYLNGSWLPNEVKEMAGPDFHWGCFAYPALTDGANGIETNNFGAQVFGINKDTKLAKEAFDLITFLTKGEYDQKLADETVGIPADTTNTEWPAMVECAKPVIEQSTNRFTWACGVESNVDMTPVIKENFIKLMAGSITADEFVSTMQDAAK